MTALSTLNRKQFTLRLGLRNICYAQDDIYYLVFYDIDRLYNDKESFELDQIFKENMMSYLVYSTKHGFHVIGLTPVDAYRWGFVFTQLKELFREKYAGNTIRLDRKEGEVKNLVHHEINYGYVIPNLYNLMLNRCDNTKDLIRIPCKPPFKHRLQIENYRSFKN